MLMNVLLQSGGVEGAVNGYVSTPLIVKVASNYIVENFLGLLVPLGRRFFYSLMMFLIVVFHVLFKYG